jgi:hypothetical protein
MFGMGRRMFSVACTAIFISVEVGITLAITVATEEMVGTRAENG